jgi:hypothetical protein
MVVPAAGFSPWDAAPEDAAAGGVEGSGCFWLANQAFTAMPMLQRIMTIQPLRSMREK